MSDKAEDSLDSLSPKRKSVSPKQKEEREKLQTYTLKQKYMKALAKLQHS